ncbi:S-layer homology domain-containing protein [Butyricicoccus pullicaecorum]|uniref:S-layer homology domain-containing protein n=1 Tax=Butyricicoccus pullicaecorum TaxID=501571 RepID=UPI00352301AD
MKSSYTKRALAFWLAVAMVATSAPMAFAREPDSVPAASMTTSGTTVTAATSVHHIKLNQESVTVTGKDAQSVTVTAHSSEGESSNSIENHKFKWSVSSVGGSGVSIVEDTGVITVDAKAKAGDYTIKAVPKDGTVTGEATATLKVVREAAKATTISKIYVEITSGKIDVTDDKSIEIPAGESRTLSAEVLDQFGDPYTTEAVSYTSNNPKVTIESSNTLKVADDATGTATITAKCGDVNKSFEVKVAKQAKGEVKIDFGTSLNGLSYTGKPVEPKVTVTVGDESVEDPERKVTYTYVEVIPKTAAANALSTPVEMSSVTDAGTYEVTATYTDGETIGRASKQFTIKQVAFSGTKDFEENVIATDGKTYTFELPQNVTSLKDVKFGTPTGMSAVVKSAKVEGNKLIITTKTATSGSDTITILVTSKNYESFNLTYKFTASGKQDVSSSITFTSDTVTYDGKNHKLSEPGFTGTVEGTKNWTYTWYKDNAKETTIGQSTMPEFKDVGVYHVTAKYEDDKQIGSKEATLTIKPAAVKSTITVTATQMSSSKDDNYKYWDLEKRSSGDGYLNLRADADDYLVRQSVNGDRYYWIGLDITPKIDGKSYSVQDLYVSGTGKSDSWAKMGDLKEKDRYIGDFYLDGISGNNFYLWFDTDGDSDNSDTIYFATDKNGSNKFELYVDFNSYSGSSSSSSGSSSSDTSKVNGDRVSTTTVDKTPSVKNGSATVTFSSSALSDALDENKKEAKREDADKTYIELDVKNSKSVDDTTITVPRSSLDKIADEDTGLKLTTNQGTVTFDYRALAEIYDACDKTNIEFYLEEEDDDQYVLLIKDGSSDVIDLGRGSVEVTFDYKLKSGEKSSDVKVYRIGNGDKTWLSTYGGSTVYGAADVYAAAPTYVTDMKADYSSSKKKVTFTTDALGTFLITTDTLKTGSGSTTTTPTYNAFVDVPSSRWSATYINKLASLGIINGTGGGYFEPTLYVTREEFVKMLAGVAGANVTGYTSSRFPDVPLSRWSAPYIAWAADRGITTGTDGGNFAPTMRITREEMATMIYRYVQSSGKTLPAKNAPVIFADANLISGWAQTPVSVMQQAGIIDGNVTNGRYTFDPKVSASREECAKMLAVLYDLVR